MTHFCASRTQSVRIDPSAFTTIFQTTVGIEIIERAGKLTVSLLAFIVNITLKDVKGGRGMYRHFTATEEVFH